MTVFLLVPQGKAFGQMLLDLKLRGLPDLKSLVDWTTKSERRWEKDETCKHLMTRNESEENIQWDRKKHLKMNSCSFIQTLSILSTKREHSGTKQHDVLNTLQQEAKQQMSEVTKPSIWRQIPHFPPHSCIYDKSLTQHRKTKTKQGVGTLLLFQSQHGSDFCFSLRHISHIFLTRSWLIKNLKRLVRKVKLHPIRNLQHCAETTV